MQGRWRESRGRTSRPHQPTSPEFQTSSQVPQKASRKFSMPFLTLASLPTAFPLPQMPSEPSQVKCIKVFNMLPC